MERLATRALFAGPVERGARYVVVDDAIVMSSTIAELAHRIASMRPRQQMPRPYLGSGHAGYSGFR
jgi:hypothetical protein